MKTKKASWKYLIARYMFLALTVILFIVVLTHPASAQQIKMPEYWTEYQDYLGNTYRYTSANLSQHPEYLKTENSTYYILNRIDDTLSIQKNLVYNGSFDFGVSDISFTIVAPASKVQNSSQANGTGQRRILIPQSVKTAYKHFQWDNKLPFVQIINNTGYNYTIPQTDYWYSRQSGQLYFNFKTVNVTGLSSDKNASFKFSSWIVDNATTSGWTSNNVTFYNMSWSGESGGSLAPQVVNTSGLVAYWSFGENFVNILHNTNNENGTVNDTNTGTYYGNASLNSTLGKDGMGNALSFDGVDDYVDIGNNGILASDTQTISFWLVNIGTQNGNYNYIIDRATNIDDWGTLGILKAYDNLVVTVGGGSGEHKTMATWASLTDGDFLSFVFNYPSVTFYKNGQNINTQTFTAHFDTNSIYKTSVGRAGEFNNFYFKGTIDEVRIWNRALSASEIASEYNASFRKYGNITISNQTAAAGNVINAARFNISYLNTLNNTANISARQNGTSTWTQIASNYVSQTWINQTYWHDTDFLIEVYGNGSSRAFIVSGDINDTQEIIPAPVITNITGNFFINHSWTVSGGTNSPDNYNVSVNSVWDNTSFIAFRNNTYSPHGWQNITVCGYDSVNSFNGSCSSQNTTIPNNLPIVPTIQSSYTVYTGQMLNFSINGTDADNDPLTYTSNNTIGTFTASGNFSYLAADVEQGNHTFYFQVADNNSGIVNQITTIQVVSLAQLLLNMNTQLNALPGLISSAGVIGFMGGIIGGCLAVSVIRRKKN